MSQPSCPVCGTSISETRFAEIQHKIRAEERANYDRLKAELQLDAARELKAALDAQKLEHESQLTAVDLQTQQLQSQVRRAKEERLEAERLHAEAIKLKVGEAETALRQTLSEKYHEIEIRENRLQSDLDQLRREHADSTARLTQTAQQQLAAAEAALQLRLAEERDVAQTRETELRERLQQSSEQQAKLEQARARELEELNAKHASDLQLKLAQAVTDTHKAATAQIEETQKEHAKLLEQVKLLEVQAAHLKESAERSIDLAVAERDKAHAQALLEQRAILDTAKAEELARERALVANQHEALRKKLAEAERKLENKTSAELGNWPEVKLAQALREAFPDDEVRPVAKGVQGADIILVVRHKGNTCGKILLDSKNHQQWRDSFVSKLAQDQLNAGAVHSILATNVFPQGVKDLTIRDGVILAKPNQVVPVVDLLRRALVNDHLLNLSRADEGRKKDRLYQLITSDTYRQSFRFAEKLSCELQEIDTQEYAAHKKIWESRGTMLRKLDKVLAEVNGSILAILESPDQVSASDSVILGIESSATRFGRN